MYMASATQASDDDLSSLVVDAEGQMARFVAKTLRVGSVLVILTYCTFVVAVTIDNRSIVHSCILHSRIVVSAELFNYYRCVTFLVMPFQ